MRTCFLCASTCLEDLDVDLQVFGSEFDDSRFTKGGNILSCSAVVKRMYCLHFLNIGFTVHSIFRP